MIKRFARLIQLTLYLFLLATGTTVLAQSNKTGRFQELQLMAQQHPDSVLIILKNLHADAIQNNDNRKAGMSLQQMGQICFNQGHYAQALDFYLHADKVFGQVGNKDLLAENLGKMG